ncbi:Pectate trisaccharide-lyase [Diplonema papillatum]|nr:Pectate trisaccharide-lyase [Diplonema papillatum]
MRRDQCGVEHIPIPSTFPPLCTFLEANNKDAGRPLVRRPRRRACLLGLGDGAKVPAADAIRGTRAGHGRAGCRRSVRRAWPRRPGRRPRLRALGGVGEDSGVDGVVSYLMSACDVLQSFETISTVSRLSGNQVTVRCQRSSAAGFYKLSGVGTLVSVAFTTVEGAQARSRDWFPLAEAPVARRQCLSSRHENGGTTGGAGGSSVTVSTGKALNTALCTRAATDTPIIIYVTGTITLSNTEAVSGSSCSTRTDQIELRGIENVSIIGKDTAIFDQIGIHIRDSSNIILQNLHVRNVKKSNGAISNGGDAIGMESSVRNVWVDHCTLEASGGESDGYDGLCDMKTGTKYVTVSYTIFKNSGRGGLVGASDTDLDNGPVTFHHNYYTNIDSRVPLLRAATAHAYNNYYYEINDSGLNSRVGAKMRVEKNYFEDSSNPLGTFYTDLMGYWHVIDNVFDNCEWTSSDHPAGPTVASTTSVTIPYSYTADAVSCVRTIVGDTAGADNGIKFSNGCAESTPAPSPGTPSTPNPSTLTPPGDNLSIGADSDGSTKATGTSFKDVRDGSLSTFWSPTESTGHIRIKWAASVTVGSIFIREASGYEGRIQSWSVLDDADNVITTGTGLSGAITFTPRSMDKVTFKIVSASGTPAVAEFETYSVGPSWSIGAGSDGSTKATGTSFKDVRDGLLSTYWSPTESTGHIRIKWDSSKTVGTIFIREASGHEGRIQSWSVLDDADSVITTGTGLSGVITFTPRSMDNVTFKIVSATDTPTVAEFETYQ